MKKIIRITESDLTRIVKRILSEESTEEFKSKITKISDKKVPGYRSMKVCAVLTVSENKIRKPILKGCTSESWGPSCVLAISNIPKPEFTKFTKCTYSCITTGKYNGIFCNEESAIANSDYSIK